MDIGNTLKETVIFPEQSCILFANLTGDVNKFHTNLEYCESKGFKSELVHGSQVLAMASRIPAIDIAPEGYLLTTSKGIYYKPVYREVEYLFKSKIISFDKRFNLIKIEVLLYDKSEVLLAKCEFEMKK